MREAIIQLSDQELAAIGLDDIVTATREAGLEDVTELVCHGAGGILQINVRDPIPPTQLNDFDSVVWWEQLTSTDTGVTYLCKIKPLAEDRAASIDDLATAHDVAGVHEGGIDLSVIGTQEAIGESIAAIDDAGMTPLLQRLTDFTGTTTGAIDHLTDRQREIIETAREMGYYEVPRETSTEAIAAEIGLDASTVAEHLQRAERNLLDHVLETSS